MSDSIDLVAMIEKAAVEAVRKENIRIESALKSKILRENCPVLKIDDVCLLTGLQRSSVYNLMNKGLISYYRPNGKQVYFRLEDVLNYVYNSKNYRKSKQQLKQEAMNEFIKIKK